MGCLNTSKDTPQPSWTTLLHAPTANSWRPCAASPTIWPRCPIRATRRACAHALPVLLATLLVALAGDANGMAAVAAFTHDHQAWFRLWLPLGAATPPRTYLRLARRLDPETAMKAALWLLDGTSLPGLRELVLALDGKVARRSGDPAAGTRPLHMVSAFLVREGLTLAQELCAAKSNEITAHSPPARPHGLGGSSRHDRRRRRLRAGRQAQWRPHRAAHLYGSGRPPAFAHGVADPEEWPACTA